MVRLMGNEKGWTLVEVIIALGILGMIGIAFFSSLSGASKALFVADERATAESLARSEMEYVKSSDNYTIAPWSYNVSTNPTTTPWGSSHALSTDYNDYTANVIAEPLSAPDDGIQKITVTVKHNDKPVITSGNFTLEGYKVDR